MENSYAENMDHDAYHRLEDMFVEGYRTAPDKLVYLRLTHIPFDIRVEAAPDSDSRMHLKSVRIKEEFEAGSVTPAFGSKRLVHHMNPHELVKNRKSLRFVYVHRDGEVEKSLRELFGIAIEDAEGHD